MSEETPSKIRKKPLAYARFMFAYYAEFMNSPEQLGLLTQDLLYCWKSGAPAKYDINQVMIDEGYEYIADKKRRVLEYKKKKQDKEKAGAAAPDKPTLFNPALPPLAGTPRRELEKIAIENGIDAADFKRWYEDTKENGGADSSGKPIIDWLAAAKSYIKGKPTAGNGKETE